MKTWFVPLVWALVVSKNLAPHLWTPKYATDVRLFHAWGPACAEARSPYNEIFIGINQIIDCSWSQMAPAWIPIVKSYCGIASSVK